MRIGLDLSLTGLTVWGQSHFLPQATAFFAAMSVQPNATRKALINTYFDALITAGIWDHLDILYLLAAHDSQAAKLNAKNPAVFTLVNVGGGPTFTADRGFTGNGTTQALSTGFTPSTDGVNFTQNDCSLWGWSLNSVNENAAFIGDTSDPGSYITCNPSIANMDGKLCDGTVRASGPPAGDGFFGSRRTTSTQRNFYRNGTVIVGFSQASTGLPSQAQWICGGNSTDFSTRQMAIAAWGASLNGLQVSFYNATLAYLQGVGAA